MSCFSSRLAGKAKKAVGFLTAHPLILTFAACLYLCAVSFMEQYKITSGGIIAIFVGLLLLSLIASVFLYFRHGLKLWAAATIFVALAAFSFFVKSELTRSERKTATMLLYCALTLVIIAIYFSATKQMTAKIAVALIFVFTIFLRFSYISITSIATRCHDVISYAGTDDPYAQGHMGYILYLFRNGFALPDVVTDGKLFDQAYHPPLHHFIAAVWLKVWSALGVEGETAYSSIQTLTLFYSLVSTVYAYKIIGKFVSGGGIGVALFAIVALHPSFYYMAADINNDMLSVALSFVALYYALRWWKSGSVRHIVLTALAVGAAMMAKLSAYMICVPIGVLFAVRFFALIKEKKSLENVLKQFAVFLAICAPLALAFPMRNMIKFGLPLTFVQRLPDSSWQYVGNYTAAQRLFDFRSLFTNIYDVWQGRGGGYHDFNPLVCLVKTSVFEEYINAYGAFRGIDFWAHVIYVANIAIIVFSIAGAAYLAVSAAAKKTLRAEFAAIGVGYAVMLAAYYVFCFEYPHHCTENMRYVTPLIVYGAIFIGGAFDSAKAGAKGNKAAIKTCVWTERAIYALSLAFAIASSGMVLIMIKV